MSGTYAALDTAEPRGGHVQELGVCHTGELSSSNEEYVFIEVRSSSHLKPVVNEASHFACLNVASQPYQQSNTASHG